MTDVATEAVQHEELPDLNLDLLRDLVFWAEGDHSKYKEDWDQSAWAKEIRNGACQTAFCIAGQAVVQAGHKLEWNSSGWADAGKQLFYADQTEDGEQIEDLAMTILGITYDEATDLFDGDNEIEDVRRVAEEICESRGLTL